jgi:hypothetical protein
MIEMDVGKAVEKYDIADGVEMLRDEFRSSWTSEHANLL